ncbi:hypothetical protein CVU83_02995 [Candidatus Falkowbacteria bacterium HGW-Falkowbacteria-2]|uniref:DUF3048 domain-containing protein n=1 Tax=Candidatus Falkowbacteria bacterium HGW-Falkowbacteria-2 TaxID=2013769 RepID=A0A2N2DYA1_9BACT|nr:MAG: hypothetical protein CVU83_02995 [Candidatus Falkowbacteria bacterium HGW-Falkowbacteria-2]
MEDKGKIQKFLESLDLDKRGKVLIGASLFVLLISALGLYIFVFAPDLSWLRREEVPVVEVPVEEVPIPEEVCADCQPRWLDGVTVSSTQALAFPVAVVIDNDILARPQAGLSKASLVYEAPVEGGITRYLAVFPADVDISEVGPVRSARPYFVSWAEEIGALYIHVGGSPEALDQIRAANLFDLNEFFNGSYFKRNASRPAPHHVMIGADSWRSYLDRRGLVETSAEPWLFKEEGDHATSSADINLQFSLSYRPMWRYDAENNDYQRFFNGEESKDGEDDIRAKNIIIQNVDSRVLDAAGRLRLDVIGTGEAAICQDGVCSDGTWRKSGRNRTRFYYENGEEIKLNPGMTWIEVADGNTRVN